MEKNNISGSDKNLDRRTMIRNGAALFGAGMITNLIAAPFQQSSLNVLI